MSRPVLLVRLLDMNGFRSAEKLWLIILVAAHLIISIVHGTAHAGANIPLSRAANLFVFIVIVAGPLAGLALMWSAQRAGALVIAIAMAGSLIFGFLNHFVFVSPDHVAHVASQWRPLFATTAVLLTLSEALSVGLAVRVAQFMENVP
jgi:hypothetical protein